MKKYNEKLVEYRKRLAEYEKMNTIVIQIGNSDNKLTQYKWANFIRDVENTIHDYINTYPKIELHFSGGSLPTSQYQNYCWVVNVPDENLEKFKNLLIFLRKFYNQDSLAFTLGKTEFI